MRRRRAARPLEIAEPVEVRFTDATFGGECRGRLPEGKVVFAPRVLPGELASVVVEEARADYARGQAADVLEASPDRVPPPCPIFRAGCGGCSWQHASYPAQLALKRRVVVEQLQRIGHLADADELTRPVIGMVEPWGYRNQARFTVGRRDGELCFTLRGTHSLLRVDACPISHPAIDEALAVLQGRMNEGGQRVHQVVIRVGSNTGQRLIGPAIPWVPELESGQTYLEEELLGRRFRLHASSFFQVNTRREHRELPPEVSRAWLPLPGDGLSQAEILALLVLDRVRPEPGDLVVDAYCGVGSFALLLAPLVESVVGIEEARVAIEDAEHNAYGSENARFLVGKTEEVLPALGLERRPDAVVLDPARVGADRRVLDALLAPNLRPERLVYVSCDPSTLARDLRILVDGGYRLREVQPLDMFPQTYHVECVATLTL